MSAAIATPERFTVAWCSHVPRDSGGDADIYNATYEYERFSLFSAAVARAKELIEGRDRFGAVQVVHEHLKPLPRPHWEDVADLYVDDAEHEYDARELRAFDVDDE